MQIAPEVLERAQGGDDAAYNQIISAYKVRILGTIARIINRPDDVEDVGQEVFVRLYFSLKQLRSPEVFETWLYRLIVNACYDYLRKSKRRPESLMSDLSEQATVLADAALSGENFREEKRKKRIQDFVEQLLTEISESDRVLLTLKEIEGLTLKELEDIYEVKENALKVRLYRARQRILKLMEERKDSAVPK
jgi:RNA polymerase sigma-70 factor (ECF subfamily)